MNFKKIADTSFKKLNFEKMKKIAGDIIILYKCTKSHNHMSSGSWDTEWNTEFLVIFGHFWPFYPPSSPMTTWKIKILKNWKKHLEISSFYTCVPKMIWCILLEVWNFFSFSNIFCPFAPHPPLTIQKSKFWKNEKTAWRYHHFTHKHTITSNDMYASWDMKCDRQKFLSFWVISCPFTRLTT